MSFLIHVNSRKLTVPIILQRCHRGTDRFVLLSASIRVHLRLKKNQHDEKESLVLGVRVGSGPLSGRAERSGPARSPKKIP